MIVEIVLTKFIAFKVHHHYVFVIISTVILSFGTAGTALYLFPKVFLKPGKKVWGTSATCAGLYALLLPVAVLLFCWLPIDPYNFEVSQFLRAISIGFYFLLFSIPFFFGGICISQILARATLKPTSVYCLDLLAAACGASVAPLLLENFNGYGSVAVASILGMVAFLALLRAADAEVFTMRHAAWSVLSLAVICAFLYYPMFAWTKYGFDIRTAKEFNLFRTVLNEFGGRRKTYWNSVARIDVSHTGLSDSEFLEWGWPHFPKLPKVEGRIVLVDGGANTRQFKATCDLKDAKMFGTTIVAAPYIAHPVVEKSLVIGGGGGADIIVAKYFGVRQVDAVELNPATYRHVLIGEGDPEAELYRPWLTSTELTKVNIFNSEARHYCSTVASGTYDVVQASGVDTLTAITSGALSSTDNYLYTLDAVKEYMRLLKPNGVLSLTQWKLLPPQLGLRLFITYLDYLEQSGKKEPWRHVVVITNGVGFVDSLMKAEPFTQPEVDRLREWASTSGNAVLFDPFTRELPQSPIIDKSESIYQEIGFAQDRKARQDLIEKYPYNVWTTTDNKPYFYYLRKGYPDLFSSDLLESAPLAAIVGASVWSLLLMFLPFLKVRNGFSRSRLLTLLGTAIFFALYGFAFLLFELCMIQQFSILVGGPVYSMAVTLVSVLAGYSLGSLLASRLPARKGTFVLIGIALFFAMMMAFCLLPGAIAALMPLSHVGRIAACAAISSAVSILCGIPVALAMSVVRENHGSVVGWMWGVSSAFNALAAISFVAISRSIGIAETLGLAALMYLAGGLLFAFAGTWVKLEGE